MFITFEGIENCGKSTQSKLLYEWLLDNGYSVILTREPGGTPSAEEIRDFLLKNREEHFPPFSEVCLYIAARGFHVKNLIKPELSKGNVVICDRFSDSTIAYQGYGRGLPIDLIKRMDEQAREGIKPDITFLIDIPVEESFKRLKEKEKDRIESESVEFHEKVRNGFLAIAKEEPERVKVIDGIKPIEEIFKEILTVVMEKLQCP
ncbi:dTMP kinase [Desulfurobacterium pacificum]|uniref:Thymidylate kinase n=1 Tax=Desulfurobacterium pacificum TaxID=240166 RepID=A0ABY1NUI5_9BACT|nr:dTMP kinase [Desulfurobacterium pacificum]SMP18710.1 dTMP kinase [Desulfurobacterium pacificum]